MDELVAWVGQCGILRSVGWGWGARCEGARHQLGSFVGKLKHSLKRLHFTLYSWLCRMFYVNLYVKEESVVRR